MRPKPPRLALAVTLLLGLRAAAQPTPAPGPKPARVIGAKLEAVPREYKGPCPVTIKFKGSIETAGPSTVRYVFDRNDGGIDTVDRHFTLVAAPFHHAVETTWTLGGPGMHYAGWEQIRIVLPNAGFTSNKANFEIWCDGAAPGGGGKGGTPDLTVTGVTVGGVTGISRAAQVTVRNVGTGPATLFKVGAFRLAPTRSSLLFTVCSLTAPPPGGVAPCPPVWEGDTLPAGASRTYTGFVTFPGGTPSGSSQRVEFMADSCGPPPEAGLPAHCRVLESNEENNTSIATVGVP